MAGAERTGSRRVGDHWRKGTKVINLTEERNNIVETVVIYSLFAAMYYF